MKKQFLLAAVVLFSAGTILMTGCKKDDTTPPSISLTGGDVSQQISTTYAEPGFSATDDEDGDISTSVSVSGTVSNGLVGMYTLSYNVTDAAGNPAPEQTREVTVKSDEIAGSYSVIDVVTGAVPITGNGTYSYTPTCAQSSVQYNKLLITNFGGFGPAVVVSATVSGTSLTIPSQSPSGMTPATTISGSGTVSGDKITNIIYTSTNALYGTGTATYTKQ